MHTSPTYGSAGAQEERDSFSKHLIGGGLVDAFRHQYPEVTGYTYWSWRAKTRVTNKGWRLDYFLVCRFRMCMSGTLSNLQSTLSDKAGYGQLLSTNVCNLQVSEGFMKRVHDCYHLTDFMGSDHCPLGLIIKNDPS